MIKVTIDGKEIEVQSGTPIVDAAKQAGSFVPTLCNSDVLEPYGACRVCSVEIVLGGRSKVVTACNYPIRGELTVKTQSERALATRKTVLEMMLALNAERGTSLVIVTHDPAIAGRYCQAAP